MSGGGWSMRMWNQMLLIWTLSKANGVDKKAVQLTASTAYTSCLISSRRKNKNRSISNVLLCFPWCPLSVFFPFLQSDVIEDHTILRSLSWNESGRESKMCRYAETNSIPVLAKAFPAEFYPLTTPTLSVYPSLLHSFRSVTQNSLIWVSEGLTPLALMSVE